jgi:predicted permease
MPNIIDVVLPTFVVILIGYLIGKFSKSNIEPVVDITLYVGVPALLRRGPGTGIRFSGHLGNRPA